MSSRASLFRVQTAPTMDIANDILFSLSSRAEAGHAWHHSDEVLFNIVKFGPVFFTPGYSGKMPAYEALLEDRDITAVNSWIASTWPTDILLAQQERTLASEQLQ